MWAKSPPLADGLLRPAYEWASPMQPTATAWEHEFSTAANHPNEQQQPQACMRRAEVLAAKPSMRPEEALRSSHAYGQACSRLVGAGKQSTDVGIAATSTASRPRSHPHGKQPKRPAPPPQSPRSTGIPTWPGRAAGRLSATARGRRLTAGLCMGIPHATDRAPVRPTGPPHGL
ncbi:hypothetical protein Dimus_034968 [Dionaea muscipula]